MRSMQPWWLERTPQVGHADVDIKEQARKGQVNEFERRLAKRWSESKWKIQEMRKNEKRHIIEVENDMKTGWKWKGGWKIIYENMTVTNVSRDDHFMRLSRVQIDLDNAH